MNLTEWSRSSVDYGQRLVNSALEGAREGEQEFLKEESLSPRLTESARHALMPALIGAYLGAFSSSLAQGRRSTSRAVAFGLLGGAIGFGAALAWENREMGSSAASGAWKRIKRTRDEHWFEKNPIDYA
jgi:hypothetical protein